MMTYLYLIVFCILVGIVCCLPWMEGTAKKEAKEFLAVSVTVGIIFGAALWLPSCF